MSPATIAAANPQDGRMPPDALFWINEVERAHQEFRRIRCVAYVFRRLFTLACQRPTNRIEAPKAALAREIASSEEALEMASGYLRAHGLDAAAKRGWIVWTFPAEWCPQPFRDDRKTLSLLPVEKTPGPQELAAETPTTRAENRPQFPGPQEFNSWPPGIYGEEREKFLAPRREFLAPRNSDFTSMLKLAATLERSQYVTPLVVLKNNPGSWPPGDAPSNSNVFVDSSSIEDVSVSGRIEALAAEIAAAHVVENHQREDADELSKALHQYITDYGDSHFHDTQPPDEEILARCLRVASLHSLLLQLRAWRKIDQRGMQKYAWFLTTFAHQLGGIPKKTLNAALSREKRSHRQTPKPKNPNPSHESAPSAQTQRQENQALLHMAAGRTRL